MSDPNYKRTKGGRHDWKKRGWPALVGVLGNRTALMKDGARYEVRGDGWRRISETAKEAK